MTRNPHSFGVFSAVHLDDSRYGETFCYIAHGRFMPPDRIVRAALREIIRGQMTVAQVAERMGVTRVTVWRWCRAKHIDQDDAAERRAARAWSRICEKHDHKTSARETRDTPRAGETN